MANVLTLTVSTAAELLNAGAYGAGAKIRLQTATTSGGTYADVSGSGSTPLIALVSGTDVYTGYDPTGDSTSWYRTRYQDTTGVARVSDWSDVFRPDGSGLGLLCTVALVKTRLGIAESDTTEDDNLTEFIEQVSTAIMGYTGRRFVRTPLTGVTTYTFDIDRYSDHLAVPAGIAEITTVEYASQTGGAYSTVATTDWFADPPIQDRDYGWPATRVTLNNLWGSRWFYPGKRTVRLTMALGWPSIPADIEALAVRAVISNYLAKGSGSSGPAAVGPTGAMFILRDISPTDMAMLARYREPMVAT